MSLPTIENSFVTHTTKIKHLEDLTTPNTQLSVLHLKSLMPVKATYMYDIFFIV